MGGTLEVTSEPGLGSSFCLQLRLVRETGKLANCPQFDAHTRPIYVRGSAPELAHHIGAWLSRMGLQVRLLTNDMHSVDRKALLVDVLASDTHYDWLGTRIIATPDGRNPPELGVHGWEVDANSIRAIVWAISFAEQGVTKPVKELSPKQSQQLQLRVLIAEDNPINREIIKEQLEVLGCSVTAAINGEQAISIWTSGLFDLVLTDVNMPILSGDELSKAPRIQDTALPIIGITANAMREEGKHCSAAGINAWLVKPLSMHTLHAQPIKCCKGGLIEPAPKTDQTPSAVSGVDRIQLSPRMRELVFNTMAEDVRMAYDMLDSGDAPALAHHLHRMGGALGSVQAGELADICMELELQLDEFGPTSKFVNDVILWLERISQLLTTLEDADL